MTTAAYLRVSTASQSVDQQRDSIVGSGFEPDRWFEDHGLSGAAGTTRPAWSECAGWLREGDMLVVAALDRLGRSVAEVAAVIEQLTGRGVVIRSLREGIDTTTATGRMIAAVMASVAELELELGRERRSASRAARLERGLPATKPHKLSTEQQRRLVRLRDGGEPVAELTAMFGVSRATVFRVLAAHRAA